MDFLKLKSYQEQFSCCMYGARFTNRIQIFEKYLDFFSQIDICCQREGGFDFFCFVFRSLQLIPRRGFEFSNLFNLFNLFCFQSKPERKRYSIEIEAPTTGTMETSKELKHRKNSKTSLGLLLGLVERKAWLVLVAHCVRHCVSDKVGLDSRAAGAAKKHIGR